MPASVPAPTFHSSVIYRAESETRSSTQKTAGFRERSQATQTSDPLKRKPIGQVAVESNRYKAVKCQCATGSTFSLFSDTKTLSNSENLNLGKKKKKPRAVGGEVEGL